MLRLRKRNLLQQETIRQLKTKVGGWVGGWGGGGG